MWCWIMFIFFINVFLVSFKVKFLCDMCYLFIIVMNLFIKLVCVKCFVLILIDNLVLIFFDWYLLSNL